MLKHKIYLPLIALALLFGSCEDNLTDLNEDPKGAGDVPGSALFSSGQVTLGTYLNSADINSNIFKLMSQHWTATTYTSESQYTLEDRQIPSNLWQDLYKDVLKDLDDAETRIQNNDLIPEAQKQNQLAQVEVLKVLTYYELVTIFGDIPYNEALDPDNTAPAYDSEEKIYTDLLDRLTTAIGNIDPSASGFGSADVFYGESSAPMAQWVKFASSLKMRLGITIADSHPGRAQSAVEDASPNAFQSNADNATIAFQSSPPHTNPIWEAEVESGRDDFLPAATYVDYLNGVEDPRRPLQFTLTDTSTTDEEKLAYLGGRYGQNNQPGAYSRFNSTTLAPDFEGMILEYAEVEFIRAEAAARGWNVSGSAAEHYENGIRADINYWNNQHTDTTITEQQLSDYLDQDSVAYASAPGDWKEKIGKQKWMAMYLQGLQGWTEWRRLNAPTLRGYEPGITEEDIPKRFYYPIDEQNLNQDEYETAVSNMGITGDPLLHRLFWDTQ